MKKLIFLLFFLLLGYTGFAQEYKFHSIYIYNFIKNIEWPADKANQDFVISVVGNNTAYREMLDILEKKKMIKNRPLVVKRCNSINEVGQSEIVFVTKYEKVNAKTLQEKLTKQGTLLVTEHEGLAANGSHINFVIDDSKLKFELNSASAQNAGLKVSNSLAGFAKKTY